MLERILMHINPLKYAIKNDEHVIPAKLNTFPGPFCLLLCKFFLFYSNFS